MLTFAAKIYQIPDLIDLVKSLVEYEVSCLGSYSSYLDQQVDVQKKLWQKTLAATTLIGGIELQYFQMLLYQQMV